MFHASAAEERIVFLVEVSPLSIGIVESFNEKLISYLHEKTQHPLFQFNVGIFWCDARFWSSQLVDCTSSAVSEAAHWLRAQTQAQTAQFIDEFVASRLLNALVTAFNDPLVQAVQVFCCSVPSVLQIELQDYGRASFNRPVHITLLTTNDLFLERSDEVNLLRSIAHQTQGSFRTTFVGSDEILAQQRRTDEYDYDNLNDSSFFHSCLGEQSKQSQYHALPLHYEPSSDLVPLSDNAEGTTSSFYRINPLSKSVHGFNDLKIDIALNDGPMQLQEVPLKLHFSSHNLTENHQSKAVTSAVTSKLLHRDIDKYKQALKQLSGEAAAIRSIDEKQLDEIKALFSQLLKTESVSEKAIEQRHHNHHHPHTTEFQRHELLNDEGFSNVQLGQYPDMERVLRSSDSLETSFTYSSPATSIVVHPSTEPRTISPDYKPNTPAPPVIPRSRHYESVRPMKLNTSANSRLLYSGNHRGLSVPSTPVPMSSRLVHFRQSRRSGSLHRQRPNVTTPQPHIHYHRRAAWRPPSLSSPVRIFAKSNSSTGSTTLHQSNSDRLQWQSKFWNDWTKKHEDFFAKNNQQKRSLAHNNQVQTSAADNSRLQRAKMHNTNTLAINTYTQTPKETSSQDQTIRELLHQNTELIKTLEQTTARTVQHQQHPHEIHYLKTNAPQKTVMNNLRYDKQSNKLSGIETQHHNFVRQGNNIIAPAAVTGAVQTYAVEFQGNIVDEVKPDVSGFGPQPSTSGLKSREQLVQEQLSRRQHIKNQRLTARYVFSEQVSPHTAAVLPQ